MVKQGSVMGDLTKNAVKSLLNARAPSSHKGDYGHALIIAGKKGSMGAAVIATKAAVRSGVGLLTVCVPVEERSVLQCSVPEAMLLMREDNPFNFDPFSAIGIGPGMGTDRISEELLIDVITNFKGPILVDADAITILSKNQTLLNSLPKETIITPHAGEFDRLFGIHLTTEDRINTAIEKSIEHNVIIVLKGHQSAIISSKEVFYNTTGNAGLAKGGSGDALTGIITSFLAQGYTPMNAAKLGVFLHGLAADITLKEQSMESMVISDVIDNLGKAFGVLTA